MYNLNILNYFNIKKIKNIKAIETILYKAKLIVDIFFIIFKNTKNLKKINFFFNITFIII